MEDDQCTWYIREYRVWSFSIGMGVLDNGEQGRRAKIRGVATLGGQVPARPVTTLCPL
jgi:hypothetical protein